jgi:hypothetical protein
MASILRARFLCSTADDPISISSASKLVVQLSYMLSGIGLALALVFDVDGSVSDFGVFAF